EEVRAIDELPRMLREVPGIGVVLIGEGDLSQNLGYPRQYEHPVVASAMGDILRICQEQGVPCGHPHVDPGNAARLVEAGYRFLMAAPTRSYAGLEAALKHTGRASSGQYCLSHSIAASCSAMFVCALPNLAIRASTPIGSAEWRSPLANASRSAAVSS